MNALIQDEAGSEGASPLRNHLKSMQRLMPTARTTTCRQSTSWVYPLESKLSFFSFPSLRLAWSKCVLWLKGLVL